MERVSRVLHHRPDQGQVFSAAMVVGVVNRILTEQANLEEHDARATSFRHGTITIVVSHSAIAGRLQQQAQRIITQANTNLGRLNAPPEHLIQELRTRVN